MGEKILGNQIKKNLGYKLSQVADAHNLPKWRSRDHVHVVNGESAGLFSKTGAMMASPVELSKGIVILVFLFFEQCISWWAVVILVR